MTYRVQIFELQNSAQHVNGKSFIDKDLESVPLATVSLSLEGAAVGDAGLRLLPSLPRLKCLDLDSTNITDAALSCLSRLPALEELWLECTRVTDYGLAALGQIRSLRFVSDELLDIRLLCGSCYEFAKSIRSDGRKVPQ